MALRADDEPVEIAEPSEDVFNFLVTFIPTQRAAILGSGACVSIRAPVQLAYQRFEHRPLFVGQIHRHALLLDAAYHLFMRWFVADAVSGVNCARGLPAILSLSVMPWSQLASDNTNGRNSQMVV